MYYYIAIYRDGRFQFRSENDAELDNLVSTYDLLANRFPEYAGFELVITRVETVKTTLNIEAMRNLLELRKNIRQNGL